MVSSVIISERAVRGAVSYTHLDVYKRQMEDIAKYANRVLVMSNKKIAMYDTVENVFARAPELLADVYKRQSIFCLCRNQLDYDIIPPGKKQALF